MSEPHPLGKAVRPVPVSDRDRLANLTKGSSGFTLIELLIVVAIIAILAAIAVPNFLDAQTRSKVSRVLTDLRSLRTANEAYCVDNTRYGRMTWGCFYNDYWILGPTACEDVYGTFSGGPARDCSNVISPNAVGGGITSPISYISTLPVDPFTSGQNTTWEFELYTYFYIDDWRANRSGMSCGGGSYVPSVGALNVFEFWMGKYVLWSVGPQGQAGLANRRFFDQYDPTNGTYSPGSVFVSHKFFQPTYVDPAQL